jgi:hypothetical protein
MDRVEAPDHAGINRGRTLQQLVVQPEQPDPCQHRPGARHRRGSLGMDGPNNLHAGERARYL